MNHPPHRYLITGGNGNLARQLAQLLCERGCSILLLDLSPGPVQPVPRNCEYVMTDITDGAALRDLFERHRPTHVLHFASLLSAKAEEDRRLAWRINADATFELMERAVASAVTQFFLPSTGATYGRNVPDPLPEDCSQWPENLYGVTKVAVERLGHYFHARHGLDFRCLRLPLIISRYAPSTAVSAYASRAFFAAVEGKPFTFPVGPGSGISTIYVKDVLSGIVQFLDAPNDALTRRVYNLHSIAPSAEEIARAIHSRVPGFTYRFEPIEAVARLIDAWPYCHIDQSARADWGWSPRFGLEAMADDFLDDLRHGERSTGGAG